MLLPTLVTLGVLLLLLAIFTGVWTDRLWFQSVDYSEVFATVLLTRAGLFIAGAVLLAGPAAANVVIAYRTRPFVRAAASRNEALDRWRSSIDPVRGRVLVVLCAVLGVLAGSVASGQWQTFMLWRNGGDWGTDDVYFHQRHRLLRLRLPVAAVRHVVRVRRARGHASSRRRSRTTCTAASTCSSAAAGSPTPPRRTCPS